MPPKILDNRIAVIDMGSNTFHLLVVDIDIQSFTFEEVYREREFIYLADNMDALSPEKMAFARRTLVAFKAKCVELGVSKIRAIGTSALRQVSNSSVFVEQVKEDCDIDIEIIGGDREAQLIYIANSRGLSLPQNALILDIGGGSVEFIITRDQEMISYHSLDIGISILRAQFPLSAFRQMERLEVMERHILAQLQNYKVGDTHRHITSLIGASGPFEILESLEGLSPASEGNSIPVDKAIYWIDLILERNLEERIALPGMPDNRADLSLESMLLIKAVLIEFPEIKQLVVSPYSLKEGVIFELI